MKYIETPVWIQCVSPGCRTGRAIDSRHLDNLNASGGWECPDHESEVPCR